MITAGSSCHVKGFGRAAAASRRIECGLQPFDVAGLHSDHIEAAGWLLRQPQQEVPGSENDPPLLDGADTGGRATERRIGPAPDFDKDQRAVPLAQHQVDFAAAPARRPIIAGHQPQARRFEMRERQRLGGVAGLLGGGRFSPEIH